MREVPDHLRYPHPPGKTYETAVSSSLEADARKGVELLEQAATFLAYEFPGLMSQLEGMRAEGDELAGVYSQRFQIALENIGSTTTGASEPKTASN